MTLLDTIHALNTKTSDFFVAKPQKTIYCHLTLSYPQNNEISRITSTFLGFLDDFLTDFEISRIEIGSMIALMAEPIKMDQKIPILKILLKWVEVLKIDEELLAGVLQSLRIFDIPFGEVYALRMAIFNYITSSSMNSEMRLHFLPKGKIELHPKNLEQFGGEILNEHLFTLKKLSELFKTRFSTDLFAIWQYDSENSGDSQSKCSQILRPLSNHKTWGFDLKLPKTEENLAILREQEENFASINERIAYNKRMNAENWKNWKPEVFEFEVVTGNSSENEYEENSKIRDSDSEEERFDSEETSSDSDSASSSDSTSTSSEKLENLESPLEKCPIFAESIQQKSVKVLE